MKHIAQTPTNMLYVPRSHARQLVLLLEHQNQILEYYRVRDVRGHYIFLSSRYRYGSDAPFETLIPDIRQLLADLADSLVGRAKQGHWLNWEVHFMDQSIVPTLLQFFKQSIQDEADALSPIIKPGRKRYWAEALKKKLKAVKTCRFDPQLKLDFAA
jgi:hypothetical protein